MKVWVVGVDYSDASIGSDTLGVTMTYQGAKDLADRYARLHPRARLRFPWDGVDGRVEQSYITDRGDMTYTVRAFELLEA